MEVIGGYISPVGDAYGKKGLVASHHRVKMCELAVQSSDWVMVDSWESLQPEYLTTITVLNHIHNCLLKHLNKKIRVMLLAGADLLESMVKPGVWAEEDVSAKRFYLHSPRDIKLDYP